MHESKDKGSLGCILIVDVTLRTDENRKEPRASAGSRLTKQHAAGKSAC